MTITHHTSSPRGFTFIEVVIVISVSTILLLALVPLYNAYLRTYAYATAVGDTTGAATATANELQRWILQSRRVVASAILDGTTYTTDAHTLVLELPSIDSSGMVIANTYDYVAFYSSGVMLYRTLSIHASSSRVPGTKLLSNALASITYTYNNATPSLATAITALIQMTSVGGHDPANYQASQTLYLRNF